jgi:hypothetical protein
MEQVNMTKNIHLKCSFGLVQQVLLPSGVVHYVIDMNEMYFSRVLMMCIAIGVSEYWAV